MKGSVTDVHIWDRYSHPHTLQAWSLCTEVWLLQVLVICLMLAIVSISFPYWLTDVILTSPLRSSLTDNIGRADWSWGGSSRVTSLSPPSASVCLKVGRREHEEGPAPGRSSVSYFLLLKPNAEDKFVIISKSDVY